VRGVGAAGGARDAPAPPHDGWLSHHGPPRTPGDLTSARQGRRRRGRWRRGEPAPDVAWSFLGPSPQRGK
jgi:hypothetical protein